MKKLYIWLISLVFVPLMQEACDRCSASFSDSIQQAAKKVYRKVGVCKVTGAALGCSPLILGFVSAFSDDDGVFSLGLAGLGFFGGYAGAQMGRRIGLELSQPHIKSIQNVLCHQCKTGKIEIDAREILFKVAMSRLR